MLRLLVAILFLALCACFTDGTQSAPERTYGQLTASLSGKPFAGTFGPDSTVAVYTPDVGQLQIEGNRHQRDWSEIVRLTMVCETAPHSGTYRISSQFFTPVSAEVLSTRIRRWLPRRWRTSTHFLVSDSTAPGILRLDTLDLNSGAISGTFRVQVRAIDRKPADSMYVTGFFAGRVRTLTSSLAKPISFSPRMGRNCDASSLR